MLAVALDIARICGFAYVFIECSSFSFEYYGQAVPDYCDEVCVFPVWPERLNDSVPSLLNRTSLGATYEAHNCDLDKRVRGFRSSIRSSSSLWLHSDAFDY
jgi:hypothetical protein